MNNLTALQATLSPQISVEYALDWNALWVRWRPAPGCNFNLRLLDDLKRVFDFLELGHGLIIDENNRTQPVNYVIFASDTPGVFQLGGDLAHFAHAITQRNEQGLREYARLCIDLLYRTYCNFHLPLMTISLVQGACLGGGFEMALATDWIIAEEQARFGFPEVRHGFLPGMGAPSFLERNLGRSQIDSLLLSGREFSAAEIDGMGLIHRKACQNKGTETIKQLIQQHKKLHQGGVAVAQARRRVQNLTFEELNDVVEIWIAAVMRLTSQDAKRLLNIASRQEKKR